MDDATTNTMMSGDDTAHSKYFKLEETTSWTANMMASPCSESQPGSGHQNWKGKLSSNPAQDQLMSRIRGGGLA